MKWLKKWSYIILLACGGLVYLVCADGWQVYAEPLHQVKNWCSDFNEKNNVLAMVGGLLWGDMGTGMGEQNGILGGLFREHSQTDKAGENREEKLTGESNAENTGGSVADGRGDNTADGVGGSNQGGASGENAGGAGGSDQGGTSGENAGGVDGSDWGGASDENPGQEVAWGEKREPEYMTVEDDYFADAVFIGDSRTVGMFEYGGLEDITTFYASSGMSVYKFYESKVVELPGQREKVTVEEALEKSSFSKVYLMLGINEMGTGNTETFIKKYSEVVARIQELQPDAIIYLQSIMKVSARRSAKGDYIHNEGIEERNEEIAKLADNEKIFYLDVNPLICDETGAMNGDYTYDGVHLKAKYIQVWKEFLKEHAIVQ